MVRSTAKVDASQVDGFARRLEAAARDIEQASDRFEEEWGDRLAGEMKAVVPVQTGRLRDSIQQVEPGGLVMVDYWRFVEYGTARMAPRSFVRPAMKRIRTPARRDAGNRAVKLIQRGR